MSQATALNPTARIDGPTVGSPPTARAHLISRLPSSYADRLFTPENYFHGGSGCSALAARFFRGIAPRSAEVQGVGCLRLPTGEGLQHIVL